VYLLGARRRRRARETDLRTWLNAAAVVQSSPLETESAREGHGRREPRKRGSEGVETGEQTAGPGRPTIKAGGCHQPATDLVVRTVCRLLKLGSVDRYEMLKGGGPGSYWAKSCVHNRSQVVQFNGPVTRAIHEAQ